MPPIEDCPCWRSHLLLQSAPKPEFWFGESVDFRWNDENSGEFRAERGVVVGVAWNHVVGVHHYLDIEHCFRLR